MILVPRLFSILQIQQTCIVFPVFTRNPLHRFFVNGSGVISPSCRDFSWCCLTLFWSNRQCPGCSPYASAVAKAIAKRLKLAAGGTRCSCEIWSRGTDYSVMDSPGGPLSRGDCPQHDSDTESLVHDITCNQWLISQHSPPTWASVSGTDTTWEQLERM